MNHADAPVAEAPLTDAPIVEAPSTEAPPGPARADALRGHIDAIAVGAGFVHLQGWTCAADGAAATMPLAIGAGGRSFPGFQVRFRADLDEAGIGGGQAAVDVVLPVDGLALDTGHAITFTDAAGLCGTIWCCAENVSPFIPLGHIEQVDTSFVQGWVFDPGATDPSRAPRLFLNADGVAAVVPGVERFDLNFDLGDGRQTHGFEIATDPIVAALRRLPTPRRLGASLALVSSGIVVASVRVRIVDGELVAADEPPARPAPYRLPASDRLDELVAAVA